MLGATGWIYHRIAAGCKGGRGISLGERAGQIYLVVPARIEKWGEEEGGQGSLAPRPVRLWLYVCAKEL